MALVALPHVNPTWGAIVVAGHSMRQNGSMDTEEGAAEGSDGDDARTVDDARPTRPLTPRPSAEAFAYRVGQRLRAIRQAQALSLSDVEEQF